MSPKMSTAFKRMLKTTAAELISMLILAWPVFFMKHRYTCETPQKR